MVTGIPKIYVLTLQGSPRHLAAKRQLRSMSLEHEFVYGRIWPEAEIPWNRVRDIGSSRLHSKYFQRCYGCKEGHIRLLEKALADGCSSILSCEDDVWFEKMDLDRVAEWYSRLTGLGGVINLGNSNVLCRRRWGGGYVDENGMTFLQSWCTDSCYLLDVGGMEFYLHGLQATGKESDMGMCDYCRGCKRNIPTLFGTSSPVMLNPSFWRRSNIQV